MRFGFVKINRIDIDLANLIDILGSVQSSFGIEDERTFTIDLSPFRLRESEVGGWDYEAVCQQWLNTNRPDYKPIFIRIKLYLTMQGLHIWQIMMIITRLYQLHRQ